MGESVSFILQIAITVDNKLFLCSRLLFTHALKYSDKLEFQCDNGYQNNIVTFPTLWGKCIRKCANAITTLLNSLVS